MAARDAQPGPDPRLGNPEAEPASPSEPATEPDAAAEPATGSEPPAAVASPDEQRSLPRRAQRASVGQTIGGILVGFDEQVWSRRPPAQERVQQIDRLGTVVTPTGLTIRLPDETGAAEEATEAAEPATAIAPPGGAEEDAAT